jgi:hypothetical protein
MSALLDSSQMIHRLVRGVGKRAAGPTARWMLLGVYLLAVAGCQSLNPVAALPDGPQPSSDQGKVSVAPTPQSTVSAPGSVSLSSVGRHMMILAGDISVTGGALSIPMGVAGAFQYTASFSGTASEIRVYLDAGNRAGQILVGLYSNSATNHPNQLLAAGRIDSPRSGDWNTVTITPIQLKSGEQYWLSFLSPFGEAARIGLAGSASLAELSPSNVLRRLILAWDPGAQQGRRSVAAYVVASENAVPNIIGEQVVNVGDGSATITWTTDRPATSQVYYGTSPDTTEQTTVDPTLTSSHAQVLGALSPRTQYYYRVVSGASAGRSVSDTRTFTTRDAPPIAAKMGEWSSVMPWPLVDVHMSLLYTGDVLMWDAWEFNGTPSVHLWNPNSQSWSPTFQSLASVPNPDSQMFCADQTMLSDGRILVVGGHNGADIGIKNTMIFDPASRQWTPVKDMNTARWYPTSIGMPDGRVLALGGEVTLGIDANVPEVYDPIGNTWQPMTQASLDIGQYPLSYLLPNGQVFIAAGNDNKSRLLNLATQGWQTLGDNPAATGTAAMYRPGKILVSGGGTNGADPVQATAATIDLNQPAPSWIPTAPMIDPRYKHSLVVLPDGTVLAVGGSSIYSLVSQKGVLDAEMWNPETGGWSLMAAEHDLRMYHSTALLLPDGRVLVAGGGRMSPVTDFQTAEIYSPPYLFKGPRPTISSAPSSAIVGDQLAILTPDAARIKSMALVRLGSVTHTYDSDQRYVDLTFSRSNGALQASLPASANVTPPGYYMLFIVDSSGVPSVAKIIRVI